MENSESVGGYLRDVGLEPASLRDAGVEPITAEKMREAFAGLKPITVEDWRKAFGKEGREKEEKVEKKFKTGDKITVRPKNSDKEVTGYLEEITGNLTEQTESFIKIRVGETTLKFVVKDIEISPAKAKLSNLGTYERIQEELEKENRWLRAIRGGMER